METDRISQIVEAALLAAGRPLSVKDLQGLFAEAERPETADIDAALQALEARCAEGPLELAQVASGYRLQVGSQYAPWVSRLWEERAPRYSRALLETLSIIAYRQPVTRGDIEDIRGVAVSSNILRTLLDRRWVRAVGQRDVPGRPALYGTTREFLDYFGLGGLSDLPELEELRDLDQINVELDFGPGPVEDGADLAVMPEVGGADAAPGASAEASGDGESGAGAGDAGDEAPPPAPVLATVTPIRPGAFGPPVRVEEVGELDAEGVVDDSAESSGASAEASPEAESEADGADEVAAAQDEGPAAGDTDVFEDDLDDVADVPEREDDEDDESSDGADDRTRGGPG